MTRRKLILPSFFLFASTLLAAQAPARDTERLAKLAEVWAAVKYLHPALLRESVDWDGAVVRAITAVRAAASDEEFARAVASMLNELGDPATDVVGDRRAVPSRTEAPLVRWAGDVVVIGAGPYAEAKGGMALWGEVPVLSKEIAKAKQVVVDLRHRPPSPDEDQLPALVISQLGGLARQAVTAPVTSYVHHSGYRPQTGGTSGGYFSGLLTVPGETFAPAPGVPGPGRVVFVTDAESAVPPIAVALQGAGQALIVSSAPISSHAIVTTKTIALGAAWRARIRVGQIGEQIAADVIASDPMAEALELVSGKKAAPAARPSVSRGSIAEPRWRPDATYREMPYPDLGHRLLAAFRIWSVIDYFYPYKALIGDWDAVLTESIPRFITASNEDEYVAAVLQMMSRIEDGHTSASGHPALARLLGAWRPPLEVRLVENEFVVTRLYEGLPPGTDVRVGDIVVSVDGEPMGARAARLRMFVTASTDTARRNRVATVALQGPAESTATLAVRGADQRTRILNVPRQPSVRPSYTGEPYRLVESAIGYVDLRRLTVPQVDAMFETLKTTTAIIFDMRGYPMGTAWDIAPRLNTKGAKVGAWFRRAQVSGVLTSEEGSAGFFFEQPLPTTEKPKYAGLTVMLIDDRAISQAEHSGLFYEAANGMTFVGTPTAGANGDVTNFFVPGGIRINFSGHDVRHADGRQLQRVGLQPDVAVTPTIAGLRAGRDEVLERAIAYVKERSR